jgi:hypothetical protein
MADIAGCGIPGARRECGEKRDRIGNRVPDSIEAERALVV